MFIANAVAIKTTDNAALSPIHSEAPNVPANIIEMTVPPGSNGGLIIQGGSVAGVVQGLFSGVWIDFPFGTGTTVINQVSADGIIHFRYPAGGLDNIEHTRFIDTVTGIRILPAFDPSVTDSMFRQLINLTSLDILQLNMSRVTSASSMFANPSLLTQIDCSTFETPLLENMRRMFSNTSALIIKLGAGFVYTAATDTEEMFDHTFASPQLTTICGTIDGGALVNTNMFLGNFSITEPSPADQILIQAGGSWTNPNACPI